MGRTRSWEVEELYVKLEREYGPAALRIVRDFEQRLDAKYSGSAVRIRWCGSKYRADSRAALWPWIVYEGIFYFPPICFRVDGRVEVPFQRLGGVPLRWNTRYEYETLRTPFV